MARSYSMTRDKIYQCSVKETILNKSTKNNFFKREKIFSIDYMYFIYFCHLSFTYFITSIIYNNLLVHFLQYWGRKPNPPFQMEKQKVEISLYPLDATVWHLTFGKALKNGLLPTKGPQTQRCSTPSIILQMNPIMIVYFFIVQYFIWVCRTQNKNLKFQNFTSFPNIFL